MTTARPVRHARLSLFLQRRHGVIRKQRLSDAAVRRMPELNLDALIARLYRNDPSFVREWQHYMLGNRRARMSDPIYDDKLFRIWRHSDRNVAHLTYTSLEEITTEQVQPYTLCRRKYRSGTKWFGWRDIEAQRSVNLVTCTHCQAAYDTTSLSRAPKISENVTDDA